MKSLGIIISTPGRRSLYRTLHSIAYQQEDFVEDVLVVGDGFHAPTKEMIEVVADTTGLPVRYVATTRTRDWGHSQLNYALAEVRGDYVTYQDDDDIYLPRALYEMSSLAAALDSPRPLLGRVKTPKLGLLWQQPLETCLDGHCLVAPNDKQRLGRFGVDHSGDQRYIHTTLRNYDECAWTDRVWTLTRPEWKLWPTAHRFGTSWTFYFARDENGVAGYQVARCIMDLIEDKFSIVIEHQKAKFAEVYEIVQFMMWACQGKDAEVTTFNSLVEQALIGANFKEHSRQKDVVSYVHDWPPDWWQAIPKFNTLMDNEGNIIKDWRDEFPGKAVK